MGRLSWSECGGEQAGCGRTVTIHRRTKPCSDFFSTFPSLYAFLLPIKRYCALLHVGYVYSSFSSSSREWLTVLPLDLAVLLLLSPSYRSLDSPPPPNLPCNTMDNEGLDRPLAIRSPPVVSNPPSSLLLKPATARFGGGSKTLSDSPNIREPRGVT